MQDEPKVGQPAWSLDPADWHWLEGGFAIPRRFIVPVGTSRWEASIEVVVSDGKARTRSIRVSTEDPGGVTYQVMQQVPIRRAMASAALSLLRRNVVMKDGTTKLKPLMLGEEKEARAVLKRVVRYPDSWKLARKDYVDAWKRARKEDQ